MVNLECSPFITQGGSKASQGFVPLISGALYLLIIPQSNGEILAKCMQDLGVN